MAKKRYAVTPHEFYMGVSHGHRTKSYAVWVAGSLEPDSKDWFSVGCPLCGADAGSFCKTKDGRESHDDTHSGRLLLVTSPSFLKELRRQREAAMDFPGKRTELLELATEEERGGPV